MLAAGKLKYENSGLGWEENCTQMLRKKMLIFLFIYFFFVTHLILEICF